MLPHRVKRHRSATSIVREFLGPQLAVIPEELVWVPAHPSYPDDGGFTYDDMLKAVKQQKHWAFVRVPKEDKKALAVIHFFAAKDVPLEKTIRMIAHEIGHLSGVIIEDGGQEEERAESYADAFDAVVSVLNLFVSQPKSPSSSHSSYERRQNGSVPRASRKNAVKRRRVVR